MFTFIDLCCGIGGFHQGMVHAAKDNKEESKCLFAADIDVNAAKVYKLNYGIEALYDLQDESTHKAISEAIGEEQLDFLFAGFPCQPFSKAGKREGFEDKIKGTIFFEIEKIIKKHKPRYVLLENVRNLENHDRGNTWDTIKTTLERTGYDVDMTIISPNSIKRGSICIPALRDRVYILAYNKKEFGKVKKIDGLEKLKSSIYEKSDYKLGLSKKFFIESNSKIESKRIKTINMWNDLYHMLKKKGGYIISPLWPFSFKNSYKLKGLPEWKKKIVKKNKKFYRDNKKIYDQWYKKHKKYFDSLNASDKKFEWNASDEIDDIWEGIIQFRPSGVRVKKPDFIPTLVAINQTPIIGCEKRYLQPEEIEKLYGFKKLKFGDECLSEKYKQLGNTVSVDIVRYLINYMLKVTEKGE